jgi:hypothetical protein
MSRKSQLTPESGTRETRWHLPIEGPWKSSPANLREMKFLRSWLVYDSQIESGFEHRRLNWRLVLGLAIVITVSASFWTGIGLLVAHIRK